MPVAGFAVGWMAGAGYGGVGAGYGGAGAGYGGVGESVPSLQRVRTKAILAVMPPGTHRTVLTNFLFQSGIIRQDGDGDELEGGGDGGGVGGAGDLPHHGGAGHGGGARCGGEGHMQAGICSITGVHIIGI